MLGDEEKDGWRRKEGRRRVISTEKLQQQLEDLKNQITREKKTNEILKKRAFVAIVKSRPGRSRDAQGVGGEPPHVDTDQSSHVKSTS